MARTKAEIRAFLDSKVGSIVPHPGYPDLNGQCVTLTKALMEFLGVPNPYKARGDAINAGDTYLREGLGTPGKGWLTIVVNRDMGYIGGVHYGHIWIDLQGEANYESNGARALYTTKNTRPISQGQQFINFDKWVMEDDMIGKDSTVFLRIGHSEVGGWDFESTHAGKNDALFHSAWDGKDEEEFLYAQWLAGGKFRGERLEAMAKYPDAKKQIVTLTANVEQQNKTIADQQKEIESLKAQVGDNSKWETLKALLRELLGTGGSK